MADLEVTHLYIGNLLLTLILGYFSGTSWQFSTANNHTLIIHGWFIDCSLIVHTLQDHMLYCGEYAARHVGLQDVLRNHLGEYGPPLHAEQVS